MSNRHVTLELLRLTDPPGSDKGSEHFGPTRHYLEVEVRYDDGVNIFSGGRRTRGYYISAGPVTRQAHIDKDGKVTGEMHGFTLCSAKSALILGPVARFSEKALEQAAKLAPTWSGYADLKQAVMDKHKLAYANANDFDNAVQHDHTPALDAFDATHPPKESSNG